MFLPQYLLPILKTLAVLLHRLRILASGLQTFRHIIEVIGVLDRIFADPAALFENSIGLPKKLQRHLRFAQRSDVLAGGFAAH